MPARSRQRIRRSVALLLACSLLAACGFQLRGSGAGSALPQSWQSLHLLSESPNSEWSRVVQNRFSGRGISWVGRDEADYILRLGPERFSQRNLSINAQARAAEFDLQMRADFLVLNREGEVVMPRTTAAVNKQMENDPGNVVGKAEEVRILRAELRNELAEQILRRISFFAASIE